MENNKSNNNRLGENKPRGNIWFTLLMAAGIVFLIVLIYNSILSSKFQETTFSDFLVKMENCTSTHFHFLFLEVSCK